MQIPPFQCPPFSKCLIRVHPSQPGCPIMFEYFVVQFLQSPGLPTPKPEKRILKVGNAILDPPEKWPQKSIEMSKNSMHVSQNSHFGALLNSLTSLNKEVRPFPLGDNSIWSYLSVSFLGDYSIWRS